MLPSSVEARHVDLHFILLFSSRLSPRLCPPHLTSQSSHDSILSQVENKEELDKEQWWRVILHNDEIHTFDYVTQSITKASVVMLLLLLLRAAGGDIGDGHAVLNSFLGVSPFFWALPE